MSKDKKTNGKYTYATGRRKTSVAMVRVYNATNERREGIVINKVDFIKYFSNNSILVEKARSPLKLLGVENKFAISVKVIGGGQNGQAEAIRLGIAKALVLINKDFRKRVKIYLTRDPRKVERKKPGLKKARRAPQWKKR